jgi:short-subunit dehydrogenase
MPNLRDHVALITGASSGIGEALAVELARRGAHTILLARRRDRLDAVARLIAAIDRRALPLTCDVTNEADIRSSVAQALAAFGRLDIVVANAGFGVAGRLERLSVADYRRQFDTNVFGVLHTVQATLDELKRTRGRLALMGSVSGYVSAPGMSPYAMSKFAVRALADALREELRPDGVSVTLIAPGFVTSEIRKVDKSGVYHADAVDPVSPRLQMPAAVAARQMAAAIARRRAEIVAGHGKLMVGIARHAPGTMRLLTRLLTARVRGV